MFVCLAVGFSCQNAVKTFHHLRAFIALKDRSQESERATPLENLEESKAHRKTGADAAQLDRTLKGTPRLIISLTGISFDHAP